MWSKPLGWTAGGGWTPLRDSEAQAQLVLLFGHADLLAGSAVYAELAAAFPAAVILGCSTGTSVAGALIDDEGVSGLAVGFDATSVRLATSPLAAHTSSRQAGASIGAQLAEDDLAAVFVLSDGLSVNGSELVDGIVERIGSTATLSGGLAGDGARFGRTVVIADGKPASDLIAAIGFYGSAIRVAHGSAGGWDVFGPTRTITKAEGNVLYELDGKPALDLYKHYLGEEAAGLPASALFYPLSIWNPAAPSNAMVRTILSVDHEARSMTFAGGIHQGWQARLMRGSIDRLVDGAADAARQARDAMAASGAEPALCLFVSCVGRRLLMGQRAQDELEAVIGILGDRPRQAGFYSYGEIAPNEGFCTLQNQTLTLTLLAEAAA